jgi:hypothetical protein
MAHLDRLVWADCVAIRAYGVRFGIRTSEAGLLPRALDRVPGPFRVSRSGLVDRVFSLQQGGVSAQPNVRRLHLLWSDHKLASRAHDREPLLDAFESALHMLFMREARGYQFVHAGCVGWRGRAIVVPGYSRSGKSTLVHALVERGATYYSDEFAVFDRRGRVHAFPAPLRLRTADGDRRLPRPDARARECRAPLPLGLVVQTHFEDGGAWRPRRLAPAETVLALLPHAARANSAPADVMKVFARAVENAAGIETPRGDAAEAAARILELLQGDAR